MVVSAEVRVWRSRRSGTDLSLEEEQEEEAEDDDCDWPIVDPR